MAEEEIKLKTIGCDLLPGHESPTCPRSQG